MNKTEKDAVRKEMTITEIMALPNMMGMIAGVGIITGIYHLGVAYNGVDRKTHLSFGLAALVFLAGFLAAALVAAFVALRTVVFFFAFAIS